MFFLPDFFDSFCSFWIVFFQLTEVSVCEACEQRMEKRGTEAQGMRERRGRGSAVAGDSGPLGPRLHVGCGEEVWGCGDFRVHP